jgi:GntR family transcriptional repressor for pyruvate dehydrogenase complex
MLIITPDIVKNFITYNVCNQKTELKAYKEHQKILNCIIKKDGKAARRIMAKHLQDVINFSQDQLAKEL